MNEIPKVSQAHLIKKLIEYGKLEKDKRAFGNLECAAHELVDYIELMVQRTDSHSTRATFQRVQESLLKKVTMLDELDREMNNRSTPKRIKRKNQTDSSKQR